MIEIEMIESCIYECKVIREAIEKELLDEKPAGKTYEAYYKVRKEQLKKINTICQEVERLIEQI